MKQFLLFALFVCLLNNAVWSQTAPNNSNEKFNKQFDTIKCVVKFSPAALMDIEAGFQFGTENKTGKNTALQTEVGYLLYRVLYLVPSFTDNVLGISSDNEVKTLNGFSFKTEVRKYKKNRKSFFSGFYFAPQLMGKYVRWTVIQSFEIPVSIDTLNNSYSVNYRKFNQYPEFTKVMASLNIKAGRQFVASSGFVFDIYTGIGMRYTLTRLSSPPNTIRRTNTYSGYGNATYIGDLNEIRLIPNFMFGFRLGWAFDIKVEK